MPNTFAGTVLVLFRAKAVHFKVQERRSLEIREVIKVNLYDIFAHAYSFLLMHFGAVEFTARLCVLHVQTCF